MTEDQRIEITKISQDFARGMEPLTIEGSGWLIVDPLSGYLNAIGYKNTLKQIPAKEDQPLILIMEFEDGSFFIPDGGQIKHPNSKNWQWIN